MKTNLLRAGALSCALLASTALTTPAMAQGDPPPTNHNIDANGVDLVLRTFEMSQTLVSIGPDWPHGLRYTRSRNDDQWVSNFTGGVFQLGNRVSVSLSSTSNAFVYSGGFNLFNPGTFTPSEADGSTLTRSGGVFTYTARNGDVARFTAEIDSNGRIVAGTGRLIDVRYPNGALVTINYRTESICDGFNCTLYVRPQSITNNFNYQLHLDYAEDGTPSEENAGAWNQLTAVRAINTAVESCDPYANDCSLTGNWPVATFSLSQFTNLETVTLPDGNAWLFTSGGGYLTGIRRPGSTSDDVTIGYDSFFRVQSVAGVAGTWTYAASLSGPTQTLTVSGPLSGSRTVVSDIVRQIVTSDQDALGRTTAYQYDSNDRLTRVTAPEGNYVDYTYDGRGNVTEERHVAKSGTGLPDMVITAAYSSSCTNPLVCNQPESVTDSRGYTTDFTYSATHGGALTVTAPAPVTSGVRPQVRLGYTSSSVGGQTVYLPASRAACQTLSSCTGAADEAVTTVSYSGSNFLPTSTTSSNGSGTVTATTAMTYDDIGNPLTVDGPLSGSTDTTRIRYNALRQVVGVIGPDPDGGGALKHRAVRTTYDAAGLQSAVETGTVNSQSDGDWTSMAVLQRSETGRDTLGRPVTQRLMSGGTTYQLTQTNYDARGRVDCVTQRMNPGEFSPPLPDACTLDTAGSFGPDRITRMTYDAADQVTEVETGYGVTGVAADEVTLTYRNNGQVETVTDANDNRTTYIYDGHDRLLQTRMPHPSTSGTSNINDFEELTYATATVGGNPVSTPLVSNRRLRDGNNIAYSYDNLGRLIAKDIPGGTTYDPSYGYDLLGRMTSASYGGYAQSFTYDALGRRLTEVSPFGTLTSTWDAAGRRTRLNYGGGLYVDYDHNLANEITAIRENGATSGAGVLATYSYDDRGRRTGVTRGNGTGTSYGYDNVSRLTSLTQNLNGTGSDVTFGYSRNPAGEIVSHTRSNDAFAYTGHANGSVANTINGRNQVTATGGSNVSHDSRGNVTAIGASGYTYTPENRLSSGPNNSFFAWDPLGRLYYAGTTPGDYLQGEGDTIAAELGSGAVLRRRYVHGPGVDEPLVWYEGTGTGDRRWFHADERGSVVAVSDGSGNLVGSNPNRYDEYGTPQGTLTGRFGYTGQAWLPDAGLYHYRNRAYSPAMGRFMQTDPIGYDGGMNLYAYVGNNPVNFTDPLGLQEDDCPPTNCFDVTADLGGPGRLGIGTGGTPAILLPNGRSLANLSVCFSDDCRHVFVFGRRRNGRQFGPLDHLPVAPSCGQLARQANAADIPVLHCFGPGGRASMTSPPSRPTEAERKRQYCAAISDAQNGSYPFAAGFTAAAHFVPFLIPVAVMLDIIEAGLYFEYNRNDCSNQTNG